MTRNDMIQTIAQACGVSGARAGAAIDRLFDEMAGAIQAGDKVPLPGIGSLSRTPTKGGQGRNPRTGEAIAIPAGHRAKFSQGKAMKDRLARLAPPAAQRAAE